MSGVEVSGLCAHREGIHPVIAGNACGVSCGRNNWAMPRVVYIEPGSRTEQRLFPVGGAHSSEG